VYDGQQRLATATILLAAIRDYYSSNGDAERAGIVEATYLTGQALKTLEKLPKLRLSQTDNEFFLNRSSSEPTTLGGNKPRQRLTPTKR